MIAPSYSVARIAACCSASMLLCLSGCMNPGMYNNYPGAYGQPMYAPPQTINPGAPGNLYIPKSDAPAYNPGGTYDSGGTYDENPSDDFRRLEDGQFYDPALDDRVPDPREPGLRSEDDLGFGVEYQPDGFSGNGGIRQVSDVRGPSEYGFDTREYRWLRGTVQQDPYSKRWLVSYSPGRSDKYLGMLSLDATGQQMIGIRSGDWIDVRGHLHSSRVDRSKRPLYVVESIVRLDP